MNINNSENIENIHLEEMPLWGKFTSSNRTGKERGFLLYPDGTIYNYESSTESKESSKWNNWGKIPGKFITEINKVLIELDKTIEPEPGKQQKSISDATVAIQYTLHSEHKVGIISKDYQTEDGKYLKQINDIVNQALASRNKANK